MNGEDPGPTAPRLLVRSARPSDSVPRRGRPESLRRRLTEPSPRCITRRVGLGRLQPTFFRFSKTCTRLVPRSRPDPRGGRVKPRVTTRRPRFGSKRALSRVLIELGSRDSRHVSRDALPADLPSLARAADRSVTPIDRAPGESRWDRLLGSPGQRELLRGS